MTSRNYKRATAHTKHAHYCSCGRVVFGNGGKAGHGYMHEQRRDGHTWIGRTQWLDRFGEVGA